MNEKRINTEENQKRAVHSSAQEAGIGNVKELARIGLMAALLCILGPLSLPLPVSPVPISLTNLGIYLMLYLVGKKRGCISYLIYLLLGLVGLPVFSGFTGGVGKLLGPTGGYLFGFLLMAWIAGWFLEHWKGRLLWDMTGLLLGTGIAYLFGSLWLSYQAAMTLTEALAAGVLPFVPGDLVKIIAAAAIGPRIRKRLQRAGVLD